MQCQIRTEVEVSLLICLDIYIFIYCHIEKILHHLNWCDTTYFNIFDPFLINFPFIPDPLNMRPSLLHRKSGFHMFSICFHKVPGGTIAGHAIWPPVFVSEPPWKVARSHLDSADQPTVRVLVTCFGILGIHWTGISYYGSNNVSIKDPRTVKFTLQKID